MRLRPAWKETFLLRAKPESRQLLDAIHAGTQEGIRSPFLVRYKKLIKPGTKIRNLVICQDIAPTLIELAGGRPGVQIQGRSLLGLIGRKKKPWRKSFLAEYWAEQAYAWLVGMSYKAVREKLRRELKRLVAEALGL